jgi:hypothetical protein
MLHAGKHAAKHATNVLEPPGIEGLPAEPFCRLQSSTDLQALLLLAAALLSVPAAAGQAV